MSNELKHFGVIGMKWGVRRYQNRDGTLTSAGKKRYVGKDGTDYSEYKSHGQKKWEKKVSKAKTDAKKQRAKEMLEMFQERDNARKEYAAGPISKGTVRRTLLRGPLYNGRYNRIMAASKGIIDPRVVNGQAWVNNALKGGFGSYRYERRQAWARVQSKKA